MYGCEVSLAELLRCVPVMSSHIQKYSPTFPATFTPTNLLIGLLNTSLPYPALLLLICFYTNYCVTFTENCLVYHVRIKG